MLIVLVIVDILTQIMPTLLTFIALPILQKKHEFVIDGFSLVWVIINFQFTLEERSMNNSMVCKIWVGMSTTNIHILQFKI